jgi:photosystem II stability/assembly factor-like uncharacterized protein
MTAMRRATGMAVAVAVALSPDLGAMQDGAAFAPGFFKELRWRGIGPFRGGRTKAAVGVPSQPGVFYIGVCNGGVWKTTDYDRTWVPVFDNQPTGSIGDIAVSLSDPNTVYVATGEGLQRPDLSTGDGIYKSTDAGRTWVHLGLRDGQQIPRIIVDPTNPDRVFAAVLGHPYGSNEERGVFRSLDGGRTFDKVLYKDENTGASDVELDPADPNTVYAALWEARQGPWESGAWAGTSGGIFKSSDGGQTRRQLSQGLPAEGVVQADLAIAPSDRKRIYASVASPRGTGIYRSDDAGGSWTRITNDGRPAGRIGGGDLPVPAVNPNNPDIVIIASTVAWKSIDGGKTWVRITNRIPDGVPVNAVREDPKRKGLLFAGTEREVHVSFDDGDHWQSLRLNMPASSVRDLIVKDDDLVAATHGRGFWVLDNITPLRQVAANTADTPAVLLKPQTAVRVRWNMNTDTPLPPDEPAGLNPPDGAMIDYYLKSNATGPVTLEILDAAGARVRRYSSADPVPPPPDPATFPVPLYWVRPPLRLSTAAGDAAVCRSQPRRSTRQCRQTRRGCLPGLTR